MKGDMCNDSSWINFCRSLITNSVFTAFDSLPTYMHVMLTLFWLEIFKCRHAWQATDIRAFLDAASLRVRCWWKAIYTVVSQSMVHYVRFVNDNQQWHAIQACFYVFKPHKYWQQLLTITFITWYSNMFPYLSSDYILYYNHVLCGVQNCKVQQCPYITYLYKRAYCNLLAKTLCIFISTEV